MKKSLRIALWVLFGLMGLTIVVQALNFHFYRESVNSGFRDGVFGEWYYARYSDARGFANYDFGSVDYPIYADDLRRLDEMLRQAYPNCIILLKNPADWGDINPIILRSATTPEPENQIAIIDIVRQWQEGIMATRSPRPLPE